MTGPPTKHQLALMIWLAVCLALGDWLSTLTPVVRTFVLATFAVPIVIYGLMPLLHRLRGRVPDPVEACTSLRRRRRLGVLTSP